MPKTLRVLLRRDISSLGSTGDEVSVAAAYAQRVLLPQGLVAIANDRERTRVRKVREREQRERDATRERHAAVGAALTGKTLLLPHRASGSRLYGSIGAAEIAAAVRVSFGVQIEPAWVRLAEPIKQLGDYTIAVAPPDAPTAALAVTVSAL